MKTLSMGAFEKVLIQARQDTNNKACKKLCAMFLTKNKEWEQYQKQCTLNTLAGNYKDAEEWLESKKLPTSGDSVLDLMKFVDMLRSKYEMEDLYSAFALFPILYCKLTEDNKYSFYGYEWKPCREEYRDMTANVWQVIAAYYGSMLLYIEKDNKNMILTQGLQAYQIVETVSDALYGNKTTVKFEWL